AHALTLVLRQDVDPTLTLLSFHALLASRT
ncbi:hypothetical protein HaLaN_04942, partial [Haematococcus lacustris]